MHNFAVDVRYALRMMQRNPGTAAVAVLALGLGIGANTAVFTILNGVLLRPLAFPQADSLVLFSYTPPPGPFGEILGMVEGQYLELRGHDRASFEKPVMFGRGDVNVTGVGDGVRLPAASVTPDFFSVIQVRPALGRDFRADEAQAPLVLLSDELWRGRFHGDSKVVGKTLKVDGVLHTVVGVMPAQFHFPAEAQLWTPLHVHVDPHLAFFRPAVARLKPGHTLDQARAEFRAFTDALPGNQRVPGGRAPIAQVLPLKDLLVKDVRQSLVIFAGAVAFVLLIACVNVANLLLMRAESRRQEIAVRMALGAGRRRLARQLLTESLVVSLIGGAAGILIALWGVPALLALAPAGRIPRAPEISIDRMVLLFTLGVSIATGLLFGSAPALQAARRPLRDSLNLSARLTGGGWLRNALAAGEIALALVLLTGAGLMLKSLWRLHAVDPGFQPGNVVTMTVNLPEAVYRRPVDMQSFHSRVLEQVSAIRGVSVAAAISSLPLDRYLFRGDVKLEGANFPPGYLLDKLVVSPGYFRALGIRVVRGRDFSERDTPIAPRVALITESAAREFWPGEDPIGKRISETDRPKSGDWYTIAGVVAEVRQQSLTKEAEPAIYFSYLQTPINGWLRHMTYVVRSRTPAAQIVPVMRAAVRGVDADQPVERSISMEDLIAATGAERTFQARLLAAFAGIALALAAIGVYGVLAYAVALRTREIGIRMALGAKEGHVVSMVLRRTATIAATGVAIGVPGALLATRVLEKMLFGVKPNDPATVTAVACILVAAALFAGWIPARRAAKVDPLVALRWE
jgi:putative ABC transport system permease protein